MAQRDLTVHIIGDSRSLQRAFVESTRSAAVFQAQVTGIGRNLARGLGAGAAVTGVASVGLALRDTTRSFLDFESSFAGVRKTVDATEPQLQALAQGFRDLSKEIPVTVDELNSIGAAAGQLGIQTGAILEFTRTVADLANTTNLSADEAANALARIANITGLPQDQFDNLGSTIVDLGNKLAATEAEIVAFSLRLAGAGNQVGLSESQIAGFAGALASVGLEAEAGGSAFSRVFATLANNVALGGKKLQLFARVSGESVSQFRRQFRTDAAGAVTAFVEGLARVSQAGGNVFGVLQQLGFGEIRVRDALLRTAGAGDLLRRSLDTSRTAFAQNSALAVEAGKRYETTESQLRVFQNRLNDVQVTLGEGLGKGLVEGAELANRALDGISAWLRENEEPLRRIWERAAVAARLLAAVLGPVIVGALKLIAFNLAIQIKVLDRVTQLWEIMAEVVRAVVGRILDALDKFLGGLSFLSDAASHLPFVGDKFAGVSDKINGAREELRAFTQDVKAFGTQTITLDVNAAGLADVKDKVAGLSPVFRKARADAANFNDTLAGGEAASGGGGGTTATQRNTFFDNALRRRLTAIQDIPNMEGQLRALDAIARSIEQQIAKVQDITRKLNLRDALMDVRRQQAGIRQQIIEQFIDSLQLGVDRAAVTKTLSDDLAALAALERGVRQQIAKTGSTNDLQRQLISIEQQRASLIQQQRDTAREQAQEARDLALDRARFRVEQAESTAGVGDDLKALALLERSLKAQIAQDKTNLALQRDLLVVQQQQRDLVAQQRSARQFRRLGLTAEGDEPVAGVGALRRRLGQITERIQGTSLDTNKTRVQLRRIAKVLSGQFGAVGKEVRAAIDQMFDDIAAGLGKRKGPLTKFRVADADDILGGVGLSPEEIRRLRGRLAKVGVGGTVSAGGAGAFGRPVEGTQQGGITITGPVTVVANDPSELQRGLQKKARRRATQTTGPNAGNAMGTTR